MLHPVFTCVTLLAVEELFRFHSSALFYVLHRCY